MGNWILIGMSMKSENKRLLVLSVLFFFLLNIFMPIIYAAGETGQEAKDAFGMVGETLSPIKDFFVKLDFNRIGDGSDEGNTALFVVKFAIFILVVTLLSWLLQLAQLPKNIALVVAVVLAVLSTFAIPVSLLKDIAQNYSIALVFLLLGGLVFALFWIRHLLNTRLLGSYPRLALGLIIIFDILIFYLILKALGVVK